MLNIYKGQGRESILALSTNYAFHSKEITAFKNLISIHWNRCVEPVHFKIDGIKFTLLPGQATTTTYLQKVEIPKKTNELTTFSFNREFYCIVDHDHEVSCNGLLFFGSSQNITINIPPDEQEKLEALLLVFEDEFKTRDNIQEEMLRMLLKRLIIKLTRLAKKQYSHEEDRDIQTDFLRKYNILVEQNFRKLHLVSDYADLMNKSPKTLANLFSKFKFGTPLQIIHERIMIEAKRMILYSDYTIKEIAYELGFNNSSAFHKLFKRYVGESPQDFKNNFKASNTMNQ